MNRCILLLFLFFCSCSQEETSYFKLSSNNIELGWEQGSGEVIINTNIKWNIASELPDWLSVLTDRKENEVTSLLVVAEENRSGEARYCEITIATPELNAKLLVIQKAKEKLFFIERNSYVVDPAGMRLSIPIERNVNYEILLSEDAKSWITFNANGSVIGNPDFKKVSGSVGKDNLNLNIEANHQKEERCAEIIICNTSFGLSDTVRVIQKAGGDYHYDGETLQLQKGTDGNVGLVIMCDGFTSKDLNYNGKYHQAVCAAADYFFSIEPYKSYRDYFNVYAVVAESEEEGVGEKGGWKKTKNKFGSAFGTGTEIVCNSDLVFEYARKVKELPADKPLTIIVVLNSTKYAGTTYLYSNGNSIALCPMSEEPSPNDFEGLIHHEAGGHGFGFLCDEYVYYQTTMPESRKQDIREWQKLGYQMNLDFTNDPSAILWKSFLGIEKYSKVGVYEGGYEYQYGVWRSEENSCMNNNIPYFNVQSRWSIVRRIMELSGKEFSTSDFIENDNFVYPKDAETRSIKKFIPLGTPKWNME